MSSWSVRPLAERLHASRSEVTSELVAQGAVLSTEVGHLARAVSSRWRSESVLARRAGRAGVVLVGKAGSRVTSPRISGSRYSQALEKPDAVATASKLTDRPSRVRGA